ncbi:MAG: ASCH domain-containing protein [Scytonematopsis contorta HA4267-MV1]|jgi:hypothetical protein|nr:ASCH domain-containing protein [Scytonematopsis contorta HA4267-MV1]
MKQLTLWQPWASLIALGLKKYETRSWATNYRGKIAIHASKRPVKADELARISYDSIGHLEYSFLKNLEYPLGQIVAVCDLKRCLVMADGKKPVRLKGIDGGVWIDRILPLEKSVGDWQAHRYAWELHYIQMLTKPIHARGHQGLRDVSEEILKQLNHEISC